MYFKFQESDVLKNTIRCYPEVEFLIYSGAYGNNVILNNRISEGLNVNSGSYSRNEINVDRVAAQRINPFIYRDSYYDAIDGNSVYSSSIGSIITGTYIENKGYTRYYITSSTQPEYTTINRIFQGYRKYIGGKLSGITIDSTGSLQLRLPFSAFMFNREIYGSRIKEGSIELTTYHNGQDDSLNDYIFTDQNGILYNSNTPKEHSGYILYHHGIIIIDESNALEAAIFGNLISYPKYQFRIKFNGTHNVQNLTMFCVADKSLNLSNNPTFILKGQDIYQTQSSQDGFKENEHLQIKNINRNKYLTKNIDFINDSYNTIISSSNYQNMIINTSSFGDGQFQKGVYISSINIYDKDKNLIAIANLANPLRKTEKEQYIIKLSIDQS